MAIRCCRCSWTGQTTDSQQRLASKCARGYSRCPGARGYPSAKPIGYILPSRSIAISAESVRPGLSEARKVRLTAIAVDRMQVPAFALCGVDDLQLAMNIFVVLWPIGPQLLNLVCLEELVFQEVPGGGPLRRVKREHVDAEREDLVYILDVNPGLFRCDVESWRRV